MNETYRRIEKLCSAHDIDITALCRNADISRASLSEFKAGRTKKLSTSTLEKISTYFDVSVDYLLTGEDFASENSSELNEYLEELRTRPEMRMYFSLAKDASKEDVETAVRIVEAYLKGKNSDVSD